jgi:hypothetical protein
LKHSFLPHCRNTRNLKWVCEGSPQLLFCKFRPPTELQPFFFANCVRQPNCNRLYIINNPRYFRSPASGHTPLERGYVMGTKAYSESLVRLVQLSPDVPEGQTRPTRRTRCISMARIFLFFSGTHPAPLPTSKMTRGRREVDERKKASEIT